jgi:hypothetical protein
MEVERNKTIVLDDNQRVAGSFTRAMVSVYLLCQQQMRLLAAIVETTVCTWYIYVVGFYTRRCGCNGLPIYERNSRDIKFRWLLYTYQALYMYISLEIEFFFI